MRLCSAVNRQIGSKFRKQAKPLEYFKNQFVFRTNFRSEVQTYGHRPPDTTDDEAAETDMYAQKCQVATASTIWEKNILFRNNWRRVNQGLNVGPIGRSPLVWGPVTWKVKPLSRSIQSSVSLTQQQQSGSNLAFLGAFVSLFFVVVGCVSRSVTVRFNVCSKLPRNTICF